MGKNKKKTTGISTSNIFEVLPDESAAQPTPPKKSKARSAPKAAKKQANPAHNQQPRPSVLPHYNVKSKAAPQSKDGKSPASPKPMVPAAKVEQERIKTSRELHEVVMEREAVLASLQSSQEDQLRRLQRGGQLDDLEIESIQQNLVKHQKVLKWLQEEEEQILSQARHVDRADQPRPPQPVVADLDEDVQKALALSVLSYHQFQEDNRRRAQTLAAHNADQLGVHPSTPPEHNPHHHPQTHPAPGSDPRSDPSRANPHSDPRWDPPRSDPHSDPRWDPPRSDPHSDHRSDPPPSEPRPDPRWDPPRSDPRSDPPWDPPPFDWGDIPTLPPPAARGRPHAVAIMNHSQNVTNRHVMQHDLALQQAQQELQHLQAQLQAAVFAQAQAAQNSQAMLAAQVVLDAQLLAGQQQAARWDAPRSDHGHPHHRHQRQPVGMTGPRSSIVTSRPVPPPTVTSPRPPRETEPQRPHPGPALAPAPRPSASRSSHVSVPYVLHDGQSRDQPRGRLPRDQSQPQGTSRGAGRAAPSAGMRHPNNHHAAPASKASPMAKNRQPSSSNSPFATDKRTAPGFIDSDPPPGMDVLAPNLLLQSNYPKQDSSTPPGECEDLADVSDWIMAPPVVEEAEDLISFEDNRYCALAAPTPTLTPTPPVPALAPTPTLLPAPPALVPALGPSSAPGSSSETSGKTTNGNQWADGDGPEARSESEAGGKTTNGNQWADGDGPEARSESEAGGKRSSRVCGYVDAHCINGSQWEDGDDDDEPPPGFGSEAGSESEPDQGEEEDARPRQLSGQFNGGNSGAPAALADVSSADELFRLLCGG